MKREYCASVLSILLSALAGSAFADSSKSKPIPFVIDAQPLDIALNAWARQSGYDLLMPIDDRITAIRAPRIVGDYSAEAALRILLSESQLTYDLVTPTTASVYPVSSNSNYGMNDSYAASGPLRLAQTSAVADESVAAPDSSMPRGVPEVLVKGSRVLNTGVRRDRDDARPYVVFDRESIEHSGAQNLDEFFRRNLVSATEAVQNYQSFSANGATSQIDISGLGTDETLILIDGRRAPGFYNRNTPLQADITSIPLSAIERIEVLRSTASGIYGGGATGGVVNIVMRRDYSGTDIKLTYENTQDGGGSKKRVDLTGGYSFKNGTTNVLFSATYSNSDPLLIGDRDLVQRGRERVLENNPNAFYGSPSLIPLGATTNIRSVSGANLQFKPAFGGASVGSARTFVPYGYLGPASDNGAALIGNAGRYNFDLPNTGQAGAGKRRTLLNQPDLKSVSVTLRQDFGSQVDGFAEVARSENIGAYQLSYVDTGVTTLAANAPSNPFTQAVVVTVPLDGVIREHNTSLKTTRASAGLSYKLSANWIAGVDYTWSRASIEDDPQDFFYRADAVSRISSGAFNVFRDANLFPIDTSSVLYPYLIDGNSSVTRTTDANIRLGGTLPFSFRGEAPTLSALLEHRFAETGDSLITGPSTSPTTLARLLFPSVSQSVDSAYVELLMPLVSASSRTRGIDTLELQLAGRYDDYRTTGASGVAVDASFQPTTPINYRRNSLHSTDPAVALRYKPVADVMVRGSFGTGFLPPASNQLSPSPPSLISSTVAAAVGITDPLRNNEPLGSATGTGNFTLVTGGNSNLLPEESRSVSAGLVFTPRFAPAARFSIDWTRITKVDAVTIIAATTPNLVSLLTGLAPERVTRATTTSGIGPITKLDLTAANFATAAIETYDFAFDCGLRSTRIGDFRLASAASYLEHSTFQATPEAAPIDNAGVLNSTFGNLRWKANVTLNWKYQGWTAAWTGRYYGAYFLNSQHAFVASQASDHVPSQTYHDVSLSYSVEPRHTMGLIGDVLAGVTVQAGVTNVFNQRPPLDATSSNLLFYSRVGDPRLATYFLSIRKSFD